MPDVPIDKFVFSMREVADILGVSISAVKSYVFRQQIAVNRIGRKVLVPRSEVLRLIERQ
jgi:excisionase family DNA binding protein